MPPTPRMQYSILIIIDDKIREGVDQMKSTLFLYPSITVLRASLVFLLATIALSGCITSGDDAAGVPSLELFAGHPGGEGNADGTGAAARFSGPLGIATDSSRNVYVADCRNHTIRKITPAAVVITLAGRAGVAGHDDGTGAAATFSCPAGVATDSAGNVYVADNNTIRKITAGGVVTTLAGTAAIAGFADGAGAAAHFSNPSGMATDSAGNVYVADTGNHVIRKIASTGAVTTLAGTAGVEGHTDGVGSAASFHHPTGVATDKAGNVYVTDAGNEAIRKITQAGKVTTLAGVPWGYTATDNANNLYVADNGNHTIHKITPAGVVRTLAGTAGVAGHADGIGSAASFSRPFGIATDNLRNVYVSDSDFGIIRKINPAGEVSTLAGMGRTFGHADGVGASARFAAPRSLATDSAGNVYVADTGNRTIRKITSNAEVTTLTATVDVLVPSGHGVGTAAIFNLPWAVATDSTGNLYVADLGDNTIRKITPTRAVITLAGTAGMWGHADGIGPAAHFKSVQSVTTDSIGNVYVADSGSYTIRKITQEGEVTTLAGTADVSGHADGTGAAASFTWPSGVAADSVGNIYVADCLNNTIRKTSASGEVTTLAGTAGVQGYADGAGAAASFSCPGALVTDPVGNIYVADSGNHTIRKVTPAGVVTTVVGQVGIIGFTPGNLPGVLDNPRGIALSGSTLYITTSHAIVRVTNVP